MMSDVPILSNSYFPIPISTGGDICGGGINTFWLMYIVISCWMQR